MNILWGEKYRKVRSFLFCLWTQKVTEIIFRFLTSGIIWWESKFSWCIQILIFQYFK